MDDLKAKLAEDEARDREIQKEIESIREDVAVQLEQSENLTRMFRKLLHRVDVVSKRHEETMAENIMLRASNRAKDEEIAALKAKLAALGVTD